MNPRTKRSGRRKPDTQIREESEQESTIKELVQRIDSDPDRLHLDVTPSVSKLIQLGIPGARAILEILDAPELLTRKRAQRVLEGVVMQRNGWLPGRGYSEPQGREKTEALMIDNGNYQAEAPVEVRQQAIAKWRLWFDAEK